MAAPKFMRLPSPTAEKSSNKLTITILAPFILRYVYCNVRGSSSPSPSSVKHLLSALPTKHVFLPPKQLVVGYVLGLKTGLN